MQPNEAAPIDCQTHKYQPLLTWVSLGLGSGRVDGNVVCPPVPVIEGLFRWSGNFRGFENFTVFVLTLADYTVVFLDNDFIVQWFNDWFFVHFIFFSTSNWWYPQKIIKNSCEISSIGTWNPSNSIIIMIIIILWKFHEIVLSCLLYTVRSKSLRPSK